MLPDEIDLDGKFDEKTGIEYIGKAKLQDNGKYVVLAKVPNPTHYHGAIALCRVEVSISVQ